MCYLTKLSVKINKWINIGCYENEKYHVWRIMMNDFDKRRVVAQNKYTLLLKIILYNTWTLQLFTIKTKLN